MGAEDGGVMRVGGEKEKNKHRDKQRSGPMEERKQTEAAAAAHARRLFMKEEFSF